MLACVHGYICRGKAVWHILTFNIWCLCPFLSKCRASFKPHCFRSWLFTGMSFPKSQRLESPDEASHREVTASSPFVLNRKWRRLQGKQQWRSTGGRGLRQTCKTATNRIWRERKWYQSYAMPTRQYLGNIKKSALSSVAPAPCVFDSGAPADGGADGPEVQWAGAVPAARQGVRGHVPPTGGGLRGWAAGQTGRGGHAQTAGQVHRLFDFTSQWMCVCCVSEWCVFVSCGGLVSCAGCIPASHKVTSWISNYNPIWSTMTSSCEHTCYLQGGKGKIVFLLHLRLLDEEAGKRAELEQLHLHQQQALSQTEAEKQELVAEQLAKERQLKAAMLQLDKLEKERQDALENYEVRWHYVKSLIKTLFAFYYTHFQLSKLTVNITHPHTYTNTTNRCLRAQEFNLVNSVSLEMLEQFLQDLWTWLQVCFSVCLM